MIGDASKTLYFLDPLQILVKSGIDKPPTEIGIEARWIEIHR